MEIVTIHNIDYCLVSNFQDEAPLRHGFNDLAKDTFNLDFEDYYKNGYWNSSYIPYALVDNGKVVANVSANILDFFVCGDMKRYIQIGTVMTDKAYRGRGLGRYLLEMVISEWRDKSDLVYLFANDTVLDFYPKFGFVNKLEYQYAKSITSRQTSATARRLDMDEPKNRDLLFRLSNSTRPFSKLTALQNTGIVMFYATSFIKDDFYYIENLDAAVFARYEGNTLYLNDIFSPCDISVEQVIFAMAKCETDNIVLGFTPVDTDGYCCRLYLQEDDTLFVLSNGKSVFDTHKLMLPILSHA